MKEMIKLILALILVPVIGSCKSNENLVKEAPKTGDIMVVAHGCTAPPYEYGLKLVLNTMPEIQEPVIKIPIPDSLKGTNKFYNLADDSLIKIGKSITQYVMDTVTDTIVLRQSVYYYDDFKYAEAITDTLGHLIFKNVPVGRYQLILDKPSPYDTGVATSNNLFFERTDFPIYQPYHPEIIKDYERMTTSVWENRIKRDVIHSPSVYCRANIINHLQVIADSISIVKTALIIDDSWEIYKPEAIIWKPEYRERGK